MQRYKIPILLFKSFIRKIIYTALITAAILLLIVFCTPVAFTACSPASTWCHLAFLLTNSGGTIGFAILLVLTALFYASSRKTANEKALVFVKSVATLALVFTLLALLNERYTKFIVKLHRPSHEYILKQTGNSAILDSIYNLESPERQKLLENLINQNLNHFQNIEKNVLKHWIEESGFSFPSGHSFVAFTFAMILAYAIYFNRSRPNLRILYLLPFIWALLVAVSRVAIGAHSALDVSVGALLGIVTGILFLSIGVTRYWLTRKTKDI